MTKNSQPKPPAHIQGMNANTNQPRQPAGSTEGGQFAATSGAESSLFGSPPAGGGIRPEVMSGEELPDNITLAELEYVTHPDRPEELRIRAAALPHPRAAHLAARDPSPLVRAVAAAHWNLAPHVRQQLMATPDVAQALEVLVGSGLAGSQPPALEAKT